MKTKYTIYDINGKGVFNARSIREVHDYLNYVARVKASHDDINQTIDYLKGLGGNWLYHDFDGYTIDLCENTVNTVRDNLDYGEVKDFLLFQHMRVVSNEINNCIMDIKDERRRNEIYTYLINRFKIYMETLAENYGIHTEVRTSYIKGYAIPTIITCFKLHDEVIPTSKDIDINTKKV